MPKRIVALTEETTEWLYLLGEQERLVGISAYTERPPEAKAEKPVVSAFIGGHVKKIKALKPDLIIGFSDVQAELARELISENLPVLITNQRSVQEIMDTLLMFGRMVGAEKKAQAWLDQCQRRIEAVRSAKQQIDYRPKVYFEEWDEPMISAIHWVGELIEIAGGDNIFADRAQGLASRERYVTEEEVIARAPDIFIGCWCGKALDEASVLAREKWQEVPAIRERQIFEMDPAIILQPGPACLTDGLDALQGIIKGHLSKKTATL
ncbi:MAG: cobalamin-binding protein [Bacteroidota bacterium]